MSHREPFSETSDESIVASLGIFARELLRRTSRAIAHGEEIPVRHQSVPLPVSRAAAADFVRMIKLWVADRDGQQVTAPPRPCPACRSENSDLQFQSFDLYPYHACRDCGTWFVPLVIDDSVFDAYFSRVPEAKRLSGSMMSGRDQLTRDSDRERFGQYFQLLQPLLGGLSHRVRYLDIGSGVGHSVELAAELGWDARGEELNEVAVATARAKGRNVAHPGTREPGAEYDVVSLFETLEHITDPDQVLADAVAALAPLGIVMITVPNRSSFEISVLRERCFHVFGGYEHVGHINLFDPRGIGVLLERHGLSLMFTDGQFGSDLAQVFSYLAASELSTLAVLDTGRLEFPVTESAYQVLNILGPAASSVERALKRSPILIALACRPEARAHLEAAFAGLERRWRDELDVTIAAESRVLIEYEKEYQATVAAIQAEVAKRDLLLEERERELQGEIGRRDILLDELQKNANSLQADVAEAQRQINLRDDLLVAAQAKFDQTVDARARALAHKLLRR